MRHDRRNLIFIRRNLFLFLIISGGVSGLLQNPVDQPSPPPSESGADSAPDSDGGGGGDDTTSNPSKLGFFAHNGQNNNKGPDPELVQEVKAVLQQDGRDKGKTRSLLSSSLSSTSATGKASVVLSESTSSAEPACDPTCANDGRCYAGKCFCAHPWGGGLRARRKWMRRSSPRFLWVC